MFAAFPLIDLPHDQPVLNQQRLAFLNKLTLALLREAAANEKKGVINLDIKPDSILVERHRNVDGTEEFYTVDFIDYGLSIIEGGHNPFEGMIVGTPLHSGPEGLEGKAWSQTRSAEALALAIRELYLKPLRTDNPRTEVAKGLPTVRRSQPGFARPVLAAVPVPGTQTQLRPPTVTQDQSPTGTAAAPAATMPRWLLGQGRIEQDGSPNYLSRPITDFGRFKTTSRTIDDKPNEIPPQLALVLDGFIARSPSEWLQLVELSEKKEPEFIKAYAKAWEADFAKMLMPDGKSVSSYHHARYETVAYGLLSSKAFSVKVFEQIQDPKIKAILVRTARNWRQWVDDPTHLPPPPGLALEGRGRHRFMAPELDAFLTHQTVKDLEVP